MNQKGKQWKYSIIIRAVESSKVGRMENSPKAGEEGEAK